MIGELVTLFIMASALSLDAFSISLGMGMLGLSHYRMAKISVTVGLFHLFMPLLGILLGKLVSQYVGVLATVLGGLMLLVLGSSMFFSSFRQDDMTYMKPVGVGLLIFSLSVSVDSFSAGLSLGILGARTVVTIVAFGVIALIFSWLGLFLGSRFQRYVGHFGEMLGGMVLIAFGLKIAFFAH
ncbi:MAG TPA: hypothetical protein GX525_00100 [Bacilli bacterium]|nr:hypothetical protein [Bacilli bacterium]